MSSSREVIVIKVKKTKLALIAVECCKKEKIIIQYLITNLIKKLFIKSNPKSTYVTMTKKDWNILKKYSNQQP